VSRPAGHPIGTFCLTPAAGVSFANTVLVATPDFFAGGGGINEGTDGSWPSVMYYSAPAYAGCSTGDLVVLTYVTSAVPYGAGPITSTHTALADVSFTFVVP
jgi:hypothetical protein